MNVSGNAVAEIIKRCFKGYHQLLSKHWCISASILSKIAEQMFRWYATHIAGLVKIACWCGTVSFSPPPVALGEDASNDEEEDGS